MRTSQIKKAICANTAWVLCEIAFNYPDINWPLDEVGHPTLPRPIAWCYETGNKLYGIAYQDED